MRRICGFIACLLFALQMPSFAFAEAHVLVEERADVFRRDGLTLAVLDARFPKLFGMRDETAMERVNEQIEDFLRCEGGYDGIVEAAIYDYDTGYTNFADLTYSLSVSAGEMLHIEDKLLTVLYDFSAYLGGAHADSWLAARQFNLATGEAFPLGAPVRDAEAFHAVVSELLLVELKGRQASGEARYFEGFEESVRAWREEQALWTGEGLLVFFNPYEVAPYVYGTQRVTIPYALIAPYLSEAYEWMFPRLFASP